MNAIQRYLVQLFAAGNLPVTEARSRLLEQFCAEEANSKAVTEILTRQTMLMDKWQLFNRITTIQETPFTIPNATAGKPYEAVIDKDQQGWVDMEVISVDGLEDTGLTYDDATGKIEGVPEVHGDRKLVLRYRLQQEPEEAAPHEKVILLIINPNPRLLWKNLASDDSDPFWKADDIAFVTPLGRKTLVAASKRGRSHANTGGFRDDDIAWKYFEPTGWSVIAVADGAGSVPLARQGAKLAVNAVVSYFTPALTGEGLPELEQLLHEYKTGTGEDTQKKLNQQIYTHLGKAALYAHKQLEEFAHTQEAPLKDLHSTLLFVLLKQFGFGYAILSFSVGDGVIGLVSTDLSAVMVMNRLDVGEFGGGTRFITMPEIFRNELFYTRFGCKVVDDFSHLFLMTDGIFDPKFVTEAALEKPGQWQKLIRDLAGENEEGRKVNLNPDNGKIEEELSQWMDFWSPGNHDDRTLAIVF